MPVVIKELHIKVTVEEEHYSSERPKVNRRAIKNHDALIDTCVEKVLEVLKQKDRR